MDSLMRIAQGIGDRLPGLSAELKDAGIGSGLVEYISGALTLAGSLALAAFAASAAIFVSEGRPNPALSVGLAALAFAFVLLMYLLRPRQMMISRGRRIEGGLIFGLNALGIETKSGVSFPQALQDVAAGGYGEFSAELTVVMGEAHKVGLRRAFEASAARNPSVTYRRVVWQLINGIETGADMGASLAAIIDDLRRMQEDDARRYGKTMEKHMSVYIMGGIVMPALAVVVIESASMLGAGGGFSGERIFWTILASSAAMQLLFLGLVKFNKPALLGDPPRRPSRVGFLEHMRRLMGFAGLRMSPWWWFAQTALASVAAGAAITFGLMEYSPIGWEWLLPLTVVLAAATAYSLLEFRAQSRGMKALEHLPDGLRMMAANLEAGICADQALLMAARPEFGVLGEELRLMGQDMMKNISFEHALSSLKDRVCGDSIHMSVDLIGHGLAAGRGLSKSLHNIAEVLAAREHARRSVGSQLSAVRTMVVLLVVFSGPLLFACSAVAASEMARFNDKMRSSMPSKYMSQGWVGGRGDGVGAEFLNSYFMLSIMVSSFIGALILGQVGSGRASDGLRYVLVMSLSSEVLYIGFKLALAAKMGGSLS